VMARLGTSSAKTYCKKFNTKRLFILSMLYVWCLWQYVHMCMVTNITKYY
jgi:hypothetical protein